ncbi:hypothetical protein OAL14_02755 [Gammaproteobacteria bacterium]|nr:hypothetical protein [Gammaproteobacteria bacterium]
MNSDPIKTGLLALAIMIFGACSTQTVRVVDMTPPKQLAKSFAEEELLDIGISVFEANVPEDFDERIEQIISPEIRRAEAQYIPYIAKNLIQSSGNWGAVRVVPRPSLAVDVILSGKIIESTGESLVLEITVLDATGRFWYTKTYTALASKYAYEESFPKDVDAFQSIYKEIADDLLDHRLTLSKADVERIRVVAEMRFAQSFSQDAFGDHVKQDEQGEHQLLRLPSEEDPMLVGIRKVREREYLFIDTIDEYYANFQRNVYPTYQVWRKSSYVDTITYKKLQTQAKNRIVGGAIGLVGSVGTIYASDDWAADTSGIAGVIGSATVISSAILKKNEAEQYAERLRELAGETERELVPTTIQLENRTVRLQGSVDEQYTELRKVLSDLYFEELGLPLPEEKPGTVVD